MNLPGNPLWSSWPVSLKCPLPFQPWSKPFEISLVKTCLGSGVHFISYQRPNKISTRCSSDTREGSRSAWQDVTPLNERGLVVVYTCTSLNKWGLVIAVSGLTEHCSIFHFPPPSSVRSSVTGVTSQLSLIIWWFRPWKPYIFSMHII